jgi:hypothetical protein
MTPIRCFMVELVNPHSKTEMVRSYCSIADCERAHESDERGSRRHVEAEAWTSEVWDVLRVDSGDVIATDAWSLSMCRIPGAMFWSSIGDRQADEHLAGSRLFASGPQLQVILPDNNPWNIDARANNCGKPADFEHRCWIRHGDPPAITVDKGGLTCTAGAGSIDSGTWHGFLRAGELVA